MKTLFQTFCEAAAARAAGVSAAQAADVMDGRIPPQQRVGDWDPEIIRQLVELVAQLLIDLIGQCALPPAELARAAKRPTFLQRARLGALALEHCRQQGCSWPLRRARDLAEQCCAEAAAAPLASLETIVAQVRDPDNWVL